MPRAGAQVATTLGDWPFGLGAGRDAAGSRGGAACERRACSRSRRADAGFAIRRSRHRCGRNSVFPPVTCKSCCRKRSHFTARVLGLRLQRRARCLPTLATTRKVSDIALVCGFNAVST